MTTKLELVGGPCDGRVHRLPDDAVIGADYVVEDDDLGAAQLYRFRLDDRTRADYVGPWEASKPRRRWWQWWRR